MECEQAPHPLSWSFGEQAFRVPTLVGLLPSRKGPPRVGTLNPGNHVQDACATIKLANYLSKATVAIIGAW